MKTKPTIHAQGCAPVTQWKKCWDMVLSELPTMYENKETWTFYHRGMKQMSCGDDDMINQEFNHLKAQGLEECNNDKVNNLHIYVELAHPKTKKALRADFTFKRFLGKEREDGSCKGQGLCPLLWGVGVMADGLTYMNVKITEVSIPKDGILVSTERVSKAIARVNDLD